MEEGDGVRQAGMADRGSLGPEPRVPVGLAEACLGRELLAGLPDHGACDQRLPLLSLAWGGASRPVPRPLLEKVVASLAKVMASILFFLGFDL